MSPEDQHKTAFVTPFVLFEYTRMPFGLCNSPATFQRLMQHVFNELVFQILLLYLNDIVIYSRTNDDHVERLDTVFRKLKEHGLKLNPSKCNFVPAGDKVFRIGGITLWHFNIPRQSEGCSGMAKTKISQGFQIVYWLCKLLSPFCASLCTDSQAFVQLDSSL